MFQTGDRVAIPPHTDAWMRGDRYGVVHKVDGATTRVLLDKSQKVRPFETDDLRSV